jgi:hypothetical protein
MLLSSLLSVCVWSETPKPTRLAPLVSPTKTQRTGLQKPLTNNLTPTLHIHATSRITLDPMTLDVYYYQRQETLEQLAILALERKHATARSTLADVLSQYDDDGIYTTAIQKLTPKNSTLSASCTQITNFKTEVEIQNFEHTCDQLLNEETDAATIKQFCAQISHKKYIDMAPLTIHTLLGRCYNHIGDTTSAIDAWSVCKTLNDNLKQYLDTLTQKIDLSLP